MTKKNKFYVTTSIPYANADPHIGFALELLYADVIARYRRLHGKDVYFLTGTDEHGQKMLKTAKEAGRPVEVFAAEKSAKFELLADQWNISNSGFIRTTDEDHMHNAREFWRASAKNGDIYKKEYSGLYCVGCESFKTEKDLVGGKCPLHPNLTLEAVSEENYFFRLSKYQKELEKIFKKNPGFVYPEARYKEMKNILEQGLEDVSISRTKEKLPWGVPVPDDDLQVMYVWFDALTNYVTKLGYGSNDKTLLENFWPADAHVIGKDINRFHSLLWPAMLMSAGLDLPKQIAVHGFITSGGRKMSKSAGNVISPLELTDKYPLDAVRYFFIREMPFDSDGDFSYPKFEERYNADLANGLGNLANRILVMIEKYTASAIPEANGQDKDMIKYLTKNIWPEYANSMENWRFDRAMDSVWKFLANCDQLITEKQPWAMAKAGKEREVKNLLHHLAEALRHTAVMIWPVMPETSERIFGQMGFNVALELAKPFSELQKWSGSAAGTKIAKPEQLFPRLN